MHNFYASAHQPNSRVVRRLVLQNCRAQRAGLYFGKTGDSGNMRTFDWDDIRCFLEVADQGSTLKAARALKLHQTTVARRLDSLEQALGLDLFERSAAGYALSPTGADLLPLAKEFGTAAAAFAHRAELNRRRQMQTCPHHDQRRAGEPDHPRRPCQASPPRIPRFRSTQSLMIANWT
jgi:Transcriptional regulator